MVFNRVNERERGRERQREYHDTLVVALCVAMPSFNQGLEYSEQLRMSPQDLNTPDDYMEFLHVYRHWPLGEQFTATVPWQSKFASEQRCQFHGFKVLKIPGQK